MFKKMKVNINNIDLNDNFYIFSFPNNDSFNYPITIWDKKPIYNPIPIQQKENNLFRIIADNLIVKALINSGENTLSTYIVNGSHLSVFTEGIINTISYRKLNIIEKANIISILLKQLNKDNTMKYMPLIGEEPSLKRLEALHSLNKLIYHLKLFIVEAKLNLNTAEKLSLLSQQEQHSIHRIIYTLSLGTNKVKTLLEQLFFIARKEGVLCFDILQDLIKVLEANNKTNIKNKQNIIFKYLLARQYPLLQAKLSKIQNVLNNLDLPKMCTITPEEINLEGTGIKLTLIAKSKDNYKKSIQKLNQLLNDEGIDTLFRLLS